MVNMEVNMTYNHDLHDGPFLSQVLRCLHNSQQLDGGGPLGTCSGVETYRDVHSPKNGQTFQHHPLLTASPINFHIFEQLDLSSNKPTMIITNSLDVFSPAPRWQAVIAELYKITSAETWRLRKISWWMQWPDYKNDVKNDGSTNFYADL